MSSVLETIASLGIVPVIAIEDVKDALPLADALLAAGLPVAEITFRTDAASEVIAELHSRRPELIVGAGTVLTPAQVEAAHNAGAAFALSPGTDPGVIQTANELGLPMIPGVSSPSDIAIATRMGARVLKLFPAAPLGGPSFLDTIYGPFAHLDLHFIPTGGLSLANLGNWIRHTNVLAIGGTWIARREDIATGRFDEIRDKATEAKLAVQTTRSMP